MKLSVIRDKIRCDEMSAEQVYIQMQQHIKNDIRSGFDTWFNLEDHDMYNFPEEAMQASWEASSKELKSSLDDADRRVGEVEREIGALQATVSANRNWTERAKREAGYNSSVSFDVVWSEILLKALST